MKGRRVRSGSDCLPSCDGASQHSPTSAFGFPLGTLPLGRQLSGDPARCHSRDSCWLLFLNAASHFQTIYPHLALVIWGHLT